MSKRIFNVLFISVFAAMLGLGIVAPLMPIYAESLGATGIWIGIIFSGFSLSRVIFMPIIGRLSDKKGRKKFITSGLLLYSFASLAYISATNVYNLTVVRLIHGFGSAMVIPIVMAYIGEISPEGEEGSHMGTFNISLLLGIGFGPFLGGILKDSFGIFSAFYAMFGLTIIAFLISLILLPEVKRDGATKEQRSTPFRNIFKNDVIKGLFLFRVINHLRVGGIMAFFPIFAATIELTSSQIGLLLSMIICLTALLQRPFGKIADQYNKVSLIIMGSLISTLTLLLIPVTHNLSELLVIGLFMGIGGAMAMPAATAMTVRVGQTVGMGASMGLFSTAMSVGMIVAPLLSGVIMDTLGLKPIFYFTGIISVIGTGIFYYFLRSYEEFK